MEYVMLFYLYTTAMNMSGLLMSADFSSKERCEEAAQLAKKKFESPLFKAFWVCAPK